MTPDQARIATQQALDFLGAGVAHRIVGVAGLEGNLGQLMVRTPVGVTAVEIPIPGPPPLSPSEMFTLVIGLQERVRALLATYETPVGRGFNSPGRGSLQPGVAGYSADDGAV